MNHTGRSRNPLLSAFMIFLRTGAILASGSEQMEVHLLTFYPARFIFVANHKQSDEPP